MLLSVELFRQSFFSLFQLSANVAFVQFGLLWKDHRALMETGAVIRLSLASQAEVGQVGFFPQGTVDE
jgi:hypothetical protein